jgi:hypothetical protein
MLDIPNDPHQVENALEDAAAEFSVCVRRSSRWSKQEEADKWRFFTQGSEIQAASSQASGA